ncbi:hypothetical protein [Bradyrhizobium sp. Leo170]|uniref:hypothetical protein n=1 Tax=Bradyrhizobium sp. Leo170 TaxID=1571199 RepID=UPI00102EA9B3|nr:hypothetical protein [Bradyrhizobium sp. Leo170]
MTKILVALLALALATGAAMGQAPQVLNRFSSWAIVRSGELISLSSDSGNIGAGCSDSTMTYLMLVKIIDHSAVVWNPDVKAFYFHFTAWADDGPPSDFKLLVADKGDTSATGVVVLNPEFNDQNTRLWAMLKAARARFSYSTPSGTVRVSAVDLAPAIARFQEECAKIFVANAHRKLKEPIPMQWLNR